MLAAVWIGLALLFYFFYAIIPWWLKRRRSANLIERIPGPPAIPILGCAYQFKWKIEEFSAQMLEFANEFQDKGHSIIRIWLGPFPIVCTFSPDSVKTVLDSQKVITKGSEYQIIVRWLGTGLLTSTGEKWRTRRKMLTPAFHFNILNGFLVIHDREARIFVQQLSKFADNAEVFDIFPFVKRCALDIICETSMGCKVDAQINHDHDYVNAVKRMNELSFLYTRMPWLWIKAIWYLTGYGREYDKNLALVTGFTRNVINGRRQEFYLERRAVARKPDIKDVDIGLTEKKRYAFLDLLLNVQDTGDLTDEDIREEVDTFMFEGHDTTSSGMAWTLWCLAHNSEAQKQVLQEVDLIFGKSQRSCTNDDLKQLKYLEQCIKEALRLFPPVPMFTRLVEEDFECAGYKIPQGATILVSPFSLHRDARLFKNAQEFNPTNFSAESVAMRHPFSYIPFSAGPRNCIGQKFAIMEEKTVLSWFFRHYTVKAKMKFDENLPCPEIILKPSNGIPVQIFKRNTL